MLEWQLVPFAAPQAPSSPVVRAGDSGDRHYFYPRRQAVSKTQVTTWSTVQRSVYSLSDGMHDVKQIALLLSQPIAVIEQVIYDLQRIGALKRK